jgi:hypothetical protein
MATQEDRWRVIATGTVDGLLAFCDWLVDKRYASSAAVGPWKSAATRVFAAVEGEESYGAFEVTGLDLDEYMRRFENAVRGGSLKAESIAAYRARVRRALDAYEQFLEDGRPPQLRQGRPRRQRTSQNGGDETAREPARGEAPAPSAASLVDYPFPLTSGEMAYLRLPKRLTKGDAERLGTFVRTLVLEPQLAIEPGAHYSTRGRSHSESGDS